MIIILLVLMRYSYRKPLVFIEPIMDRYLKIQNSVLIRKVLYTLMTHFKEIKI